MRGLDGAHVLVTGGTRGIGFATARRFLEEGSVGAPLRPDRRRRSTRRSSRARPSLGPVSGSVCDVSDEDSVADARRGPSIRRGDGVDVLINNAGISWREPFLDITRRALGRDHGGQPARHVPGRSGGRAADGGDRRRRQHRQHGLDERPRRRGRLRALQRFEGWRRAPHQDDGGRARATRHPRQRTVPRLHRHPAQPADRRATWTTRPSSTGTSRRASRSDAPGREDDVAAAYAFLASDDASFITGTTLVVDGGQTAVM